MTFKTEMKSPIFWFQAGWYALGWYVVMFIVWFFLFFTPVTVVDSSLEVTDGRFKLNNWTYKTALSLTLCDIPPIAFIVFENDSRSKTARVIDNARGAGSGNEKTRLWSSTGEVPDNMPVGENIFVYKKLIYPCLGFNKVVYTPTLSFYNSGVSQRGME